MSANQALRLVAQPTLAAPGPVALAEPPPVAIMATLDPAPFLRRFAGDSRVLVFGNGVPAMTALAAHPEVSAVVADFRALPDRWTGQGFLRRIRGEARFEHVNVYILADSLHDHQIEWLRRCGAAGMLPRNADAVARSILGDEQEVEDHSALDARVPQIDAVFAGFAGPMHRVHTQAARESIALGLVEPSPSGYAKELASKLRDAGRRQEFLETCLQLDPEKSS